MKENKIENQRTCLITRQKLNKSELFQIKFSPKWEFIFWKSEEKNIWWRSIYIQNDKKIFEQFLKRPKNFLENFFKRKISGENFLELKNILNLKIKK